MNTINYKGHLINFERPEYNELTALTALSPSSLIKWTHAIRTQNNALKDVALSESYGGTGIWKPDLEQGQTLDNYHKSRLGFSLLQMEQSGYTYNAPKTGVENLNPYKKYCAGTISNSVSRFY